MMSQNHQHISGLVRREFLQVGFSGFLGWGASSLLGTERTQAAAPVLTPRAKSLILVFLTGAPSHIDTLDLKPDAPEGIRGEFKPIATKAPGVEITEHLPRLAAMADRLAIIRSMSHEHRNHLNATHWVLTGHAQPGAFFDKIADRGDYPCIAGALDAIRPPTAGVPTGVTLPTFLREGPLVWPGQNAGFLGAKHDPWQITQDPNSTSFRVDGLGLPQGFTVEKLNRRVDLLREMTERGNAIEEAASADAMNDQRRRALALLHSGRVAKAFDINSEDPKTRDRYGRHMFGQSLLLARRLVEAGVPIVQANMGRVQNWDTHHNNFGKLKKDLLPPLDRAVAALLDDLAITGKLDETLVVVTGEFGRTPRIGANLGDGNGKDGRDHWSAAYSCMLAGAGVRGGQVIGRTDKTAAYPASRPFTPADLSATIYRAFGVDPGTELIDRLGRPIQLCQGEVIESLYTGAPV